MTGSGALVKIGGRIFEMGGSTDLILGSVLGESDRFERFSPINEIVSGFTGGGSATGSTTGTGVGVSAGCFALLIGGTPVFSVDLASVVVLFLPGVIRSVAGCGGGGGVATFSAGGSAFVFAFWEGSFLLLARVAMNLSL